MLNNQNLRQLGSHRWWTVLLITFTIVAIDVAISFNSALLPNLKGDFQISEKLTQWTVSIALLALGISGLFYGAMSDSFGRRPVLLTGLSLFSLGSLGSALSTNITLLLVARFIQGFGAGVGWIVGNACLKDLFDDKDYLKVMNLVHAMAGIVPAIAPATGSYLAEVIGWRSCFGLIFVFSAFVLFTKFWSLPETNHEKQPITLKYIKSVYANLLSNKLYLKYLIVKVLTVMLLFIEISNIPLIYVDYLGVPSSRYGLYVIPGALLYILANYFSSLLNQWIDVGTVLYAGLIMIVLSNLLILVFNAYTPLSAIEIQSLKLLTYIGWGLIFGNATGALISAASSSAGAASAMMISLEMLCSSLGIYITGLFFNGTIVPVSIFMVIISIASLVVLSRVKINKKLDPNPVKH